MALCGVFFPINCILDQFSSLFNRILVFFISIFVSVLKVFFYPFSSIQSHLFFFCQIAFFFHKRSQTLLFIVSLDIQNAVLFIILPTACRLYI